MIITEKMIKELQRRVDISYEEAERYLRRAGGNLDIAEAYAYRKANSFFGRIFSNLEKLINATLVYRLRLYKNNDVFLNTPVFFFILLVFLIGVDKALFVGVVFVIIALVADCNIEIKKIERNEPFSFYRTVDKSSQKSGERKTDSSDGVINEVDVILGEEQKEEIPIKDGVRSTNNSMGNLNNDLYYVSNDMVEEKVNTSNESMYVAGNDSEANPSIQTTVQINTNPNQETENKDKHGVDDNGYYEVTIDK